MNLNVFYKRWGATIQPVWQLLSRRRRRQLLAFVPLSLLCAVAEVANIGVLLPFLKVLASPAEGLSVLGPWAQPLLALNRQQLLAVLGIGFLGLVVISSGLRVLTTFVQLRLTALIGADLGSNVIMNVLHRPYLWHLNHNSSEILTLVSQDVNIVVGTVQSILGLVINGLIVLLLFGALMSIYPMVTITITLIISGVYVLIYLLIQRSLYRDGQIYTESYQRSVQAIQESLGGVRDILLDRSQSFFTSSFDRSNRAYRLASARINAKAQTPRFLIEGAIMIVVVGLSLVLALKGEGVEKQLPLLGTLALGAYRILQPAQQCFGTISGLKANQPSWQRVSSYLEPVSSPSVFRPSDESFKAYRSSWKQIRLHQVCFDYNHEGPWVLDGINLVIGSGSRVAFVGTTGSGKSTTIDVILGLIKPVKGQLLIDDKDLYDTPGLLESWQRQIGHVPQQIYLSDGSFAENIAFGIEPNQINLERVRISARQACIAELIEKQPHGYSTIVGERGIRLSGGQRQRLGIARALYKEASILVFDEATSALDNQTEKEVIAAIEGLQRSISVVMIAHRISSVQRCDVIHVMEHGRIIESGTYPELLARSSAFRRLAAHKIDETVRKIDETALNSSLS